MKLKINNSPLILMSVFMCFFVLSSNGIAYSQNIEVTREFDSIVLEKDSESLKTYGLEPYDDLDNNGEWELIQIGKDTLSFGIDGPHGSGRYFSINLLKVENGSTDGNVGFGTFIHTGGSRTFLYYQGIRWFEDIDLDGDKEFVLWNSFEYFENYNLWGLIAWVYKWDGTNSFVFSPELTKKKGIEIVSIYRTKLDYYYGDGRDELYQKDRDILANALEQYLNEYLK